ncbi:hypothetical protein Q6348_03035 [Isoptericola sp. b441]|uniref:WxL domain-containing protein n=1 Tax=Actinotalea lenta TaxID=3064654 RepID=A0ABT9D5S8_9CELL|nr:hypothetical protein [Isoptericola sp. b441]MDO8106169.1 hypothetical protein [Isoptericola sp. b441]
MRRSLRRGLGLFAGTAALLAMTVTGAMAAQGPPPGKGHGGGETTLSNNLSVPTIMVGGGFTNVSCPAGTAGDLVVPTGEPSTGYPIDPAAYYYVQGLNAWQAQCITATSASAKAAWGANLTGDASLTTNSPIRVELGLYNADVTAPDLEGYSVVKLNTNALDRESPYGTLATGSADTGFSAVPTTFTATQQRVYDAGVTFSVQHEGTSTFVVPEGTPATAEINATGTVVYGYNLRVTDEGKYTITFTVPTVTLTGTDAGSYTDHSVSLSITVAGSRGGGSHGGHGPGR